MSQLLHLFTLFTDTEVKWKTITVLKSMNLIDALCGFQQLTCIEELCFESSRLTVNDEANKQTSNMMPYYRYVQTQNYRTVCLEAE